MFKITKYELKTDFDLIIAHFSDIHYANKFDLKKLDEIVSNMSELKPNYICITGDLIDNIGVALDDKMTILIDFLNKLSKISKVIVGLGNHDTRKYKDLVDNKWYEKLDKKLILLNNSSYEDEHVYFYGLTMDEDYYHHEKRNKLLLNSELSKINVSKNKYNILLFHSPINLEYSCVDKFDLILVGHTHRGLTPNFIPGNFGLVAPHHHLFLKNARNSFKVGASNVIISGGITKLSYGTKIFKIFDCFFTCDLNYIYFKKS